MTSEVVNAFISRCYHDDKIMIIKPFFNETYIINDKKYKFTEELLNELHTSNRVNIVRKTEKYAIICGIEGMN